MQAIAQKGAGQRSDVWSFGGFVLNMASGQAPWRCLRLKGQYQLFTTIESSKVMVCVCVFSLCHHPPITHPLTHHYPFILTGTHSSYPFTHPFTPPPPHPPTHPPLHLPTTTHSASPPLRWKSGWGGKGSLW